MDFIELINSSAINYVIITLHIIATYLFFYRYFDLHRINLDTEDFLLGLKNNLRRDVSNKLVESISICDDAGTPMASVAKSIISRVSTNELLLHHAAEEAASVEIPKLQKNMRLISTIGQVAIFLGMLGTVLAMIELFDGSSAAVDLGLRDIGPVVQKALVTTALGIASAMIVHMYNTILMENSSTIVNEMEKTAIELINFITNDPSTIAKLNSNISDSGKENGEMAKPASSQAADISATSQKDGSANRETRRG